VLVNGYRLNHTALSVHNIAGHQGDIYAFANDLVMKDFKLNEEGGIMKVCACLCKCVHTSPAVERVCMLAC
jgi:hypothetical protein